MLVESAARLIFAGNGPVSAARLNAREALGFGRQADCCGVVLSESAVAREAHICICNLLEKLPTNQQ
jgi:hypothetical protein